jgi:hypothetical protein
MPYVVKITGRTGNVTWLTRPNADGFRTLGIRAKADIFATEIGCARCDCHDATALQRGWHRFLHRIARRIGLRMTA